MARFFVMTSTGVASTTGATTVAAATNLDPSGTYLFSAVSACWIRQGTSKLVTCVAKASINDGETVKITINGASVTYEFDVAGNGVAAGNVQVNISTDTTAANVAARLATAIQANQTALTVTNPANGTLIVDLPESTGLTITDTVANVGFTIGTGIMQATAGNGSTLIPAGGMVYLDGNDGGQVGVIQDTVGGHASVARVKVS